MERIGALLLTVALLVGVGVNYAFAHANEEYVTFTVSEKDRASKDGGGSSFRVATTEGSTYEVRDSFWFSQWRSDDVYRQFKEGKTYRAHVAGIRFGLFSWFPYIISAKEVPA